MGARVPWCAWVHGCRAAHPRTRIGCMHAQRVSLGVPCIVLAVSHACMPAAVGAPTTCMCARPVAPACVLEVCTLNTHAKHPDTGRPLQRPRTQHACCVGARVPCRTSHRGHTHTPAHPHWLHARAARQPGRAMHRAGGVRAPIHTTQHLAARTCWMHAGCKRGRQTRLGARVGAVAGRRPPNGAHILGTPQKLKGCPPKTCFLGGFCPPKTKFRDLPVEQASCLVEHGMCVFYPRCKHGSRQTMRDARGWRGSFMPGSSSGTCGSTMP